jgi:hypothetical protein
MDWSIAAATWIAIGVTFDMMVEEVNHRKFTGRFHRVAAFLLYAILGPIMGVILFVLLIIFLIKRGRQ